MENLKELKYSQLAKKFGADKANDIVDRFALEAAQAGKALARQKPKAKRKGRK